jgi:hypothetical protein
VSTNTKVLINGGVPPAPVPAIRSLIITGLLLVVASACECSVVNPSCGWVAPLRLPTRVLLIRPRVEMDKKSVLETEKSAPGVADHVSGLLLSEMRDMVTTQGFEVVELFPDISKTTLDSMSRLIGDWKLRPRQRVRIGQFLASAPRRTSCYW